MAKGTLVVNARGQIRIKFTNANDKAVEMAVPADELSRELKAEKPQALNGREVELDVVGGLPKQVRTVSQPFQGVALPPPPPPRAPGPPQRPQGGHRPPPASPPVAVRPKSDFVNPYNFLPAVARDKVPSNSEFRDRPPTGHDRFHDGHFTGVLHVKLTTETPLLIPDAARGSEDSAGHKTFPMRVGADGKPYLAPTAVKGMLRAAYEAVTNSRFGVFAGWDRYLAYRRQAKVDVEPAIVVTADPDRVEIDLLDSLWLRSPAKLPRYVQRPRREEMDKGENYTALRYPDKNLPQHGDHVWVTVEGNGRVSAIRRYAAGLPGHDWLEGWVLITGANINNKKAERVFVVSDRDERVPVPAATGAEAVRLHRLWSDLIRDYQQIHEKDLEQRRRGENPWDYLGNEPGRTAWSRHVYTPAAANLTAGQAVYVRRDQRTGRIVGLYPVAISRQLFDASPLDSLDTSLHPATDGERLSPADRVFGWVNQKGKGAHRGQLRVGPVAMTAPPSGGWHREFKPAGLPLAILGQPKPQQVRFYLGDTSGRSQGIRLSKEEAGYGGGKRLRGRKVYVHHKRRGADHWTVPEAGALAPSAEGTFREYLRPDGTRDNQNRSVRGWVNPGTAFAFDLHVTNLSAVELGALVWLLTLDSGHFHRLGLGKPLGFGSVRLDIATDRPNEIADTAGWKQFYRDFGATAPPSIDLEAAKLLFVQELERAYPADAKRMLDAFRVAAKGIEDRPVHYPRDGQPGQPVAPNPRGEAYEWFVANDDRTRQYPLPELTDPDPGLPTLPRR